MANNYLANELKKHYQRVGNKVVFSNGMTLNKLAVEMWERLDYEGIDSSVLSRVLNGERNFTFKQLDCFCDVLGLTASQKSNLKGCLLSEINLKFGESVYLGKDDKYFVLLAKESLRKIRQFREQDLTVLTVEWIEDTLDLIRHRLRGFLEQETRRELMATYAELLIEKIFSQQVTQEKTKGLISILKTSRDLAEIGKELNNQSYVSLANIHAGDIYYINSMFKNAIELLTLGSNTYDKHAKEILPWTPLRPLALSYAYTGKSAEFDNIKKRIIGLLPSLGLDAQCLALEGISRGAAILGRKTEWQKYLSLSTEYQKKLEKSAGIYKNLMNVILIGSELEVYRRLNIRQNSYIRKRGVEGKALSDKYGYNRIAGKIKYLIAEKNFENKLKNINLPVE